MSDSEITVDRNADITLREITAETVNAILRLSVSEPQQQLVASNAVSIAQAYFRPEAWFRAIYADETPVGFVMLYDAHLGTDPPQQDYYEVWRFMIDARYQGNGFGRRAMELVIAHVRTRPNAKFLFLGHRREPGNAGGFYPEVRVCIHGECRRGRRCRDAPRALNSCSRKVAVCWSVRCLNPMETLRDIAAVDRHKLVRLFATHHHLRPDIDAVLQGYCGSALANSEHDPRVAQLAIGVITFFGGDPTHPLAPFLVEQLSGEKIIIVANGQWRALVHQVYGNRITSAPRITYTAQYLNLDHLRQLSARIPEGFRLERITQELAQRIRVEVDPDLIHPEVFPSAADFVARGIGFCARTGDHLVCGATSAARSDAAIEIQINTHPSYRQRGLATTVAAALVAHCVEHELYPDWETSADNAPSQQLAQRLGYVPGSPYEWLVLSD